MFSLKKVFFYLVGMYALIYAFVEVKSSVEERACWRTPTGVRAYTDRSSCVHRPKLVRTPTGVRQHERASSHNFGEHLRITCFLSLH